MTKSAFSRLFMCTCAVVAGLATGPAVMAQDAAPAYVLVELNVTDAEGFKEYGEKVPGIIAAHGGTVLVNAEAQTMEGTPPNGRVIIVRFPNVESVHAWLESPEYMAIRDIRHRTAETRQLVVEGLPVQ